MKRLSNQDLASRREFDWRVVRKMSSRRYTFTAHRTPQDATEGRCQINNKREARFALHYRARYNIRTLVGPGEYSPYTIIRVDVSHTDYPFGEPIGWVVEDGSSKLPYSPHFARGLPICNGSIWRSDGHFLLGHYLIHVARLLNWDEELRPEYEGYNAAAVSWWRENIGQPLDAEPAYPALPIDDLYGRVVVRNSHNSGFRAISASARPATSGGFKKIG